MNRPRLIDANELKERITSHIDMWADGEFYVEIDAVLRDIEDQPTTYDIDKVVEQLEKLDDEIPVTWEGQTIGMSEAIEIVKKGGVG